MTSFCVGEIGSNIHVEALLELLFDGVLLVVYLIGLPFANGKLLRFGLLFHAGSLIFVALTSLLLATAKAGQIPYPSPEANLGQLFLVLGTALGALSAVCFSYGILRFQPSYRIVLGVQVLLALGLTWEGARAMGFVPPPPDFGADIVLPILLMGFLGLRVSRVWCCDQHAGKPIRSLQGVSPLEDSFPCSLKRVCSPSSLTFSRPNSSMEVGSWAGRSFSLVCYC